MFYATGLPGWMRSGAAGDASAAEADPTEATQQALRDQVETLQAELEATRQHLAEVQAARAAE
jgi:prefoldin subunit 5